MEFDAYEQASLCEENSIFTFLHSWSSLPVQAFPSFKPAPHKIVSCEAVQWVRLVQMGGLKMQSRHWQGQDHNKNCLSPRPKLWYCIKNWTQKVDEGYTLDYMNFGHKDPLPTDFNLCGQNSIWRALILNYQTFSGSIEKNCRIVFSWCTQLTTLKNMFLAKNWNRQDIFIDNSRNISKNTKFRQTHLSIIVTDQAAPATAGNGHLENTISGKVFRYSVPKDRLWPIWKRKGSDLGPRSKKLIRKRREGFYMDYNMLINIWS